MIKKVLVKSKLHLYILALLPILSLAMVSIAIALFAGFSLYFFFTDDIRSKISKKDWLKFILFSTPFSFYVIALIWTDDLSTGLKFIEQSLSFLILPFSIFILKPFKTSLQLVLFNKIYIIACVAMVVLVTLYLIFNSSEILSIHSDYSSVINLRNNIEQVPLIGEHAIYFSLLVAMGLLLLFHNPLKNNVLNVIFISVFICGLVLASSKGVIISIITVSVLIIFQRIKNKLKAMLVLLLVFAGIGFLTYYSPLKIRIDEIIENKYKYPEGVHFNSINMRTAIMNCSFSLITKAGLIGFAPADVQKELNLCYKKFNTNAFDEINYNTHNQYIDYVLSFGIIGLGIILFCFVYFIKIAIRSEDKLYFNVLVLFFIVFLFENILVRNTGIVLFTTFNCLFAYYSLNCIKLKDDSN